MAAVRHLGLASARPRPPRAEAAACASASYAARRPGRARYNRPRRRLTATQAANPIGRSAHAARSSALKSMKVMFATPCYISAVSMNYVASIFELTLHARISACTASCTCIRESLITARRATRW